MKALSFSLIFFLISCSASRKPIPVGVIPQVKSASVADEQYGHQILTALTNEYPLDYNHPRAAEVYNIVDKLTKAAGAGADPWHVYIFKDPKMKNAAATRGNHVFIWTGLLDITKNEAELAAILAHEISHVLAGHTDPDPNEELKKLFIGLGSMVAGIAVSTASGNPSLGQNLGKMTAGATQELASGLLIYPYSRDNELEADRIGLLLMAQAKYDPRAAIEFWDRAQNDPDFSASIAFFSTHPPASDRLAKLREILPLALSRYSGTAVAEKIADPKEFKETNSGTTFQQKSYISPIPSEFSFDSGTWKLEAAKAILYEKPDSNSAKRGEFLRDAIIEVVSEKGNWLEIRKPDSGFLQKSLFKRSFR